MAGSPCIIYCFVFLRQDSLYLRPAPNVLCSWGWLWTSDFLALDSWDYKCVPRCLVCGAMFWAQGFVYARQDYQSYIFRPLLLSKPVTLITDCSSKLLSLISVLPSCRSFTTYWCREPMIDRGCKWRYKRCYDFLYMTHTTLLGLYSKAELMGHGVCVYLA